MSGLQAGRGVWIGVQTFQINQHLLEMDDPNCKEACCMAFPCASVWVRYNNKEGVEAKYHKKCGPCLNLCNCCPWTSSWRGTDIGTFDRPGCCDNGCAFCLCPWCVCSGDIALMYLKNMEKQDTHSMRMKMSCCWPLGMSIGGCCGPCVVAIKDCCMYCSNNNYVLSRELVWPAEPRGKKIETENRGHPIGEYFVSQRVESCGCQRIPMKIGVKMYDAGTPDPVVAQFMLQPLMWAGLPVPCCRFCVAAPIPTPHGCACADTGRYAKVNWGSKVEMENMLDKDLRVDLEMGTPGTMVMGNKVAPAQ